MSSTPSLLQKIDTLEGLTTDEKAQLKGLLNTQKKYGLVWEDKPEDVERQLLENLPVLVEVKERYIAASQPETREAPQSKKPKNENQLSLGLEVETESSQPDSPKENPEGPAPHHILIEGDNLHALTALSFTHKEKIDVIYIDPPYNTGNKDFKYNDTFVDKEDSYRHSKWLSFMHKRLELSKQLLKETGVIFISIDDNEQAQLKLLCDSVFREESFIAQIVWQKRTSPDARRILGPAHDSIYVYGKSEEGYAGLNHLSLSEEQEAAFKNPDNDPRGAWVSSDFTAQGFRPNQMYSITTPGGVTYEPPPGRCWKNIESVFLKQLKEGKMWFGKDGKNMPRRKTYLSERKGAVPWTWWDFKSSGSNQDSKKEVIEILGKATAFSTPKPVRLLERILKIGGKSDATILDFFAGSGTTLHATMQLNNDDGGSRKCILVTNNENNIAEDVCYERNRRVIQGYSKPNGDEIEGFTRNHLHYYKAAFVPAQRNQINRRQIVDAATEIICIRESAFTELSSNFGLQASSIRLFQSDSGQYNLVLYYHRYMDEAVSNAVALIEQLSTENGPVKIYAFAPQGERYEEELESVKDKIKVIPLPEAIYNAYQASLRRINVKRYRDSSFTQGAESTEQTEINFTPTANARK